MKSVDGQYSLLMFILKYCKKNYPNILEISKELEIIHKTAKMDIDMLEKQVNDMVSHMQELPKVIKAFKKSKNSKKDAFPKVMKEFYEYGTKATEQLQQELKEMHQLSKDIAFSVF